MHGVRRGVSILRARLRRCGEVHRRVHGPTPAAAPRRAQRQRGDCDLGCDGCDLPGGSSGGSGRKGSCLRCGDVFHCDGCSDCGDLDRGARDAVARIGPLVLGILVVILALAAAWRVTAGCVPGLCAGFDGSMVWLAWWATTALSAMFGVGVLILRIRRGWPLGWTIAWLAALGILAGGMFLALDRWTRLIAG